MTDNFKDQDQQANNQPLSFKEQILADLEEAVRQRRLREEAELEKIRLEKEEEKRQAELERQRLEQVQAQKEAERQAAEQEKNRREIAARAALEAEKAQKIAQQQEESKKQVEQDLKELSQSQKPNSVDKEEAGVDLDKTQQFNFEELKSDENRSTDLEETRLIEPLSISDAHSDEPALTQETLSEEAEATETVEIVEDKNQRRRRHRQKNNKIARKISIGLVSIILGLILIAGILTFRFVASAVGPVDANSTEYVQVEVPLGSGNKLIGQILEEAGAIKSATVFNYYTKFKNYSNFQSGYYNIQKNMDLDDIAKLLQEGGTEQPVQPALGKVLIPEGYTIKQIAEAVAVNSASDSKDASPFSAEEFLETVKDETFIEKMVEKYPKLLGSLPDKSQVTYQLEGYLFPATYNYYKETTVEDLIDQMLAAMDSNLAGYYDSIAAKGMTVNEVLTLASLVEKEGSTDDDRKNIASVFYNRLSIDMPLQSNIAILYAMGTLGQKTSLQEDATVDTDIDSPYNVYKNTGLMPGPVDSPSAKAIEATVNPADTDYLYFVADVTTGAVYYTTDYNEHLSNVEKYVNSKLTN